MSMCCRFAVLVLALVFAGFPLIGNTAENNSAEPSRFLTDMWSFRLSGSIASLDTDVGAGATLGALVDVEEVLGFDDTIGTFSIEGKFRFAKNRKHSLRFSYISLDRQASAIIDGSVPIFDLEFTGAVNSEFDNRVFTLGYEYSFVNDGRTEAGFIAGLATYRYLLAVEGQAIINNDPSLTQFASEQTSVIAPVPSFGLFVYHALTPDLILELRSSFIDLEIGEHNGRVFNTFGNLTWYFSQSFGIGLGLGATDISYSQENSEGHRLKVDYAESTIDLSLALVF